MLISLLVLRKFSFTIENNEFIFLVVTVVVTCLAKVRVWRDLIDVDRLYIVE